MNSFAKLALVAAFALFAAACGASRYYNLPVSAQDASTTYAPIQYAAEQMGFKAYAHENTGVTVNIDDVSTVYFQPNQQNLVMMVNVDDKRVPADQLQAKLDATRAKGDEIWHRAMDARRETGTVILGH